MDGQTKLDHCITLHVDQELSKSNIISWFQCARDNIGSGIVMSVPVDGKPVHLIKTKDSEGVHYAIPLSRDVTSDEVTKVIEVFAQCCSCDFKVSATTSSLDYQVNPDVVVDHDPLHELCAKWAKDKHENWRKGKEGEGWRYGPVASKANRTHPLLRPWDDIPSEYRKVDTTPVQEMLDLLKETGYVMIHREDLDKLLGE